MLPAFHENQLVFTEVPMANASDSFPMTINRLEDKFDQYGYGLFTTGATNKFIWKDFLTHCTFDFSYFNSYTSTRTKMERTRRFSDPADLVDFVNNTTANNGSYFSEECILKVYSPIGGHLPTINKLTAYNHFYASLVGGHKFTKGICELGNVPSNLPTTAYRNLIIQAYNSFFGIDITANYDSDPASWRASAWVQKDKTRNLYKLPKFQGAQVIEVGSASLSRVMVDVGTLSLSNVPIDSKWELIDSRLFGCDAEMGPGASINLYDSFAQATMTQANTSYIMVYLAIRGSYRALYIKPFGGIDTICFPKLPDGMRIEAIIQKPGKRYRFGIPSIPGTTHTFMGGRMTRWSFFIGAHRNHGVQHRLRKGDGWNIRYYVRDTETGYVSQISKCYLDARVAFSSGLNGIEFAVGYDSI